MSRLMPREILAKQLTNYLGITINPDKLVPAKGYWRTSSSVDCLRWESIEYSLGSFDTMRDCIKYGFSVGIGPRNNSSGLIYEVSANK